MSCGRYDAFRGFNRPSRRLCVSCDNVCAVDGPRLRLAEAAIRGNADRITLTFDSVLGVPTRIYVDHELRSTDEEDDHVVYELIVTGHL